MVNVDRVEVARAAYWADVKHDDHAGTIKDEWRDDWWQTNVDMPLSGKPFLSRWLAIADAILSLPQAPAGGEAKLREAIEAIASRKPRPEQDDGEPGQRCQHCGYRRRLSEPMEHGPGCAYRIAVVALSTVSARDGGTDRG